MFDISSPSIYIPLIFLTLIAILASFMYKDSKKNMRDDTKDLPYFHEIGMSMNYIERNLLENGRFQYRNNVDTEIKYDNKSYNSLRHAGVLYSMYMYEKLGLVDKYKESRIKASKYFVDRYVKKLGKTGKYIVLSMPEEEQIKIPIAKSGAAGVALCALSNLYPDGEVDLKILQGLGEFILSMQDAEGNIYAYYDLSKKFINKEAQAQYYPGEAAAGLMYLYEVDSQEKWLNAAKKTVL